MENEFTDQKYIISFKRDLLKRLKGSPTNLSCKDEKLYIGDQVKIYYDHFDPGKYVFGIVKYNSIKHISYIRLKNTVDNFFSDNTERNIIKDKDLTYFSNNMEKVNSRYHNDYNDCVELMENDKVFFQKILDLFYDERIYLLITEVDWIERFLKKIDINITIENINDIDKELYDEVFNHIEKLLYKYFDTEEKFAKYNFQIKKR